MEIRMRALLLVTVGALALAGCGGTNQASNTTNVDQTLAAGTITSNDVTAIDAVTAEDSNMAADVPLINALDNAGESAGNTAGPSGPKPRPTAERPAARPAPAPSPGNSASNAAATATTNNAL